MNLVDDLLSKMTGTSPTDRARWAMVFARGGQRALDAWSQLLSKPCKFQVLRDAIERNLGPGLEG